MEAGAMSSATGSATGRQEMLPAARVPLHYLLE